MALLEDEEALIICNGYKDEEYIETALLASKLGRTVILVVEKPSELPLIADDRQAHRRAAAHRHPRHACRPAAPGAGRPRAATARSSACPPREMLEAIDVPARATTCSTASSCCTSTSAARSPSIRAVKNALREAGRFYVELRQAGRAAAATSTSAAAWASTTTARRPTSPRR